MKRSDIEEQIKQAIDQSFKSDKIELDYEECITRLTDLFIQLSEERAKQQNIVCMDLYVNYAGVGCYESDVANLILNAPLPELK